MPTAARLGTGADRVRVRQSIASVHPIRGPTHRVLCASPTREAQSTVPTGQPMDVSRWLRASEDIVAAQAQRAAHGGPEPAPSALEFHSSASESDEPAILVCDVRCACLRLSDGSFAQLESVVTRSHAQSRGHTQAPTPASQSASAGIDAHSR